MRRGNAASGYVWPVGTCGWASICNITAVGGHASDQPLAASPGSWVRPTSFFLIFQVSFFLEEIQVSLCHG